jgi:hypothetical protein
MTPSTTPHRRRNAQAPKSGWEVATLTVSCGFAISVAYVAALILIGDVFGWEGDLANFFVFATPAIPVLSLAVGSGLLAARAPRPVARAVAAIACVLLALFTVFVVRLAWTFTMTTWLVW